MISLVSLVGCTAATETSSETETPEEIVFNYYTADTLKESLASEKQMHLIDIQVEDEYSAHHIQSAVATYAYPVKSDEDKAKLDLILSELTADENPIVIVCPRGGGGAERTFKHLQASGLDTSRLFILENGQEGWPHAELLAN